MLKVTPEVETTIDRAIMEDLSIGDPTTEALIPADLTGTGVIVAKAQGVLAGIDVALAVFKRVEPCTHTEKLMEDGARLKAGDRIALVSGPMGGILKGERTALNFLQRMSGIATETARYVEAVKGFETRVIDTRKTVPGLRTLDKYAVKVGGGHNHRRNLGDGVLIKDNHILALQSLGMSLKEIIQKARSEASHTIKIEVEVESLAETREALDAGAELVMLDNMSLNDMRKAVEMARGRAITEASGGINLERARAVAETGVDLMSIGALTHSVKALDISLDVQVQ